jgi:hypothetical protein
MLAAPMTSLLAHPGHDHAPLVSPSQPAHWFIEPEHATTWLIVSALTWTFYRVLTQRTVRSEPTAETYR